jgi:hypothetical protein
MTNAIKMLLQMQSGFLQLESTLAVEAYAARFPLREHPIANVFVFAQSR